MDSVLAIVGPIFWGLLMFSVLVFLHEGGHFIAARACGVRVTEFFLGLPFRWSISRVSNRIGTRFGVTPLLLGGYAMICGMEPTESPCAPQVLSLVHRRGTASVDEIACELGIDADDAMEACVLLMGWGSLKPVYDAEKGETPNGRFYPTTYSSMPRDERGLTIYDGRAFDRAGATEAGEPWEPPFSDEAFFEAERSHTYIGKGFAKRALMLVAGVLVNILSGFLLLMSIYSIVGISVSQNVSAVGTVEAGSIAEQAGLSAGDRILEVGDERPETWEELVLAIREVAGTGEFELVYEHDGETRSADVELDEDEALGITVPTQVVRLNPIDSASLSFSYVRMTAESILQLVNPSQTLEVLDNSTSIVGISVMSYEAASDGAVTYLTLAALISFSLGFMNLLPVPPLDGGKLLIEVIQVLIRRPLPLKVQNALSYIGIVLFGLLFFYVLRGDILRFFL